MATRGGWRVARGAWREQRTNGAATLERRSRSRSAAGMPLAFASVMETDGMRGVRRRTAGRSWQSPAMVVLLVGGVSACAGISREEAIPPLVGAAAGAGAGALLGGATGGNAGEGALIGAGVGAVGGSIYSLSRDDDEDDDHEFER